VVSVHIIGVRVGSCTEKEALVVARWRRMATWMSLSLSDPVGEVGEGYVGRNWRSVSTFELVKHR
jgi:hypothetical protein